MTTKRELANARRLRLAQERIAAKEAAAAAEITAIAMQRLRMPQWDGLKDASGAPIWNGRSAKIYSKPFNKRMLLVDFVDGSRGKVWMQSKLRSRFIPGDEVWVVPDGPDWRLIGDYNGSGRRVG